MSRFVRGWMVALLLLACREQRAPGAERRAASASALSGSTSAAAAPAPSLSAPVSPESTDTLSRASSYDGGAPVVATGRVDGAALRARHIARLKSDRSPVVVLAGAGPLELGQRVCEQVVPKRPKDTPILVKPNLCGFDGIKNPAKSGGDDGVRGRITGPEFLRGVLRCLKTRGHTRITLAEGCGNSHQHWRDTIRVSGYEAMAAEEQVPLVALDDDGVFDREGDAPGKPLAIDGIEKSRVPRLLMPKLLAETLERGLFISVPKLKAHRYSVVSLGIKGMQGTVMRSDASPAYNQKWRMHEELKDYLRARKHHEPEDRAQYVASLELFAQRMLDVLEISLPDAVLVDGAPAVSGDGFQNLRELPGSVAIGGTNPVFVDRVGAEYLGLWNNAELGKQLGGYRSSPLIELAARRYGLDLRAPELIGDGAPSLKQPRPVFFKAIAPFTLQGDEALPPPLPPDRPSVHAARAAAAPTIDGKREPIWNAASPAEWQSDYAGAPSGIGTRARFLWNDGALFTLFELEGAGLNVDRSFPIDSERQKLYLEDCVELFLAPDPARRQHYYEIELGPLGHFFDLEVDRARGQQRTEWSSGLRVATSSDAGAKRATIEARFTAPELVSALKPGARLPLGLFRMEGAKPRRYLAWSPARTRQPNFHVPEAFGTLIVD